MRINIHLGFPRVGIRSLDFVGRSILFSDPKKTRIVPQRFFQKNLRSTINQGRRGVNFEELNPASQLLRSTIPHQVLVLSQPALLGEGPELIVSQRARKRASVRIGTLCALFAGHEINLHILIKNPYSYVRDFLGPVADFGQEPLPFSWREIIEDLQLVGPDRAVHVWDFQEPSFVLEPFLCELLGQPLRYSSETSTIEPEYLFFDASTEGRAALESSNAEQVEHYKSYKEELGELRDTEGLKLIGFQTR